MRRATITIPDDLEAELDSYLEGQEVAPSLTNLVEVALRRYLEETRLGAWQYRPPRRPPVITPANQGSGRTDVSEEHDRYLAENE